MTYLHLVIGNMCPNKCLFCASGDLTRPLLYDEIISYIDRYADQATGVSLSGGEPSAHPDFVRIVKYIKETHDLPIVLLTNSIPFADKNFADAVTPYIKQATCSFYSYTPLIYNHITRNPDAYTDTVAGIKNLIDGGVDIQLKTLINLRPTYRSLYKTTQYINELFEVDQIHYSGVDVSGTVITYPNIVIPFNRVAAHFTKALDAAIEVGMKPYITFYPLCLIPQRQRKFIIADHAAPIVCCSETEDDADRTYDNIYPHTCDRCTQKHNCPGVWKNYIETFGERDLKPIEA